MTGTRSPIPIVHIITGLAVGGAETMLVKLLSATDRSRFVPTVVSLLDGGMLGPRIEALGIEIVPLGMGRGRPSLEAVWRLVRLLRQLRPQIIQTWMYHADLLGSLAASIAGRPPVVWNIRHSDLDREGNSRLTRLVVRGCAWLSHLAPRHIVCASERARDVHAGLGYRSDIMTVIPNGFDVEVFRPDTQARADVRAELGVSETERLVGLVGRFDPQKDHAGFVRAARRVVERLPEARFLLCGRDVVWDNQLLVGLIEAAGLRGRFHLLGVRNDMPRICAALDVAVSASAYGEAFPNVIGEAMSCAVPCVVTDVGDSARIVGETGRVVPPRDPDALAAAILALLDMPAAEREALGQAARVRTQENFSLAAVARQYQSLYEEVLGASRQAGR